MERYKFKKPTTAQEKKSNMEPIHSLYVTGNRNNNEHPAIHKLQGKSHQNHVKNIEDEGHSVSVEKHFPGHAVKWGSN